MQPFRIVFGLIMLGLAFSPVQAFCQAELPSELKYLEALTQGTALRRCRAEDRQ